MKILFWTDGFWPRLGGVETQGLQFILELQARGHQCLVMAQKDQWSCTQEEVYQGIPIQRFDFNAVIISRDLTILGPIQTYLKWVIDVFKPDIIHLNASDRGSAFVFLLFMKMFRSPLVLTAHAPYLQGKFDEIEISPVIEKIAIAMDRICCVSNWVFEELVKYLPMLKPKLSLIYNGLPMPDCIPLPLPFSPPTLLCFGRLSWEKGFDVALQAFSLLKKRGSNAQLIVAGDGAERISLEKLAVDLEISHAVRFIGIVKQEEVFSLFNQATLVIVPSILESFGLVILESMQMARPVVASLTQGIPEVVSDGETGCLFPVRDPMALCQTIEHLLKNEEMAQWMGLNGRKKAAEFTIHKNATQYEALYTQLQELDSCVP